MIDKGSPYVGVALIKQEDPKHLCSWPAQCHCGGRRRIARSFTLLIEPPQGQAAAPSQVAYPNASARIPVNVTAGRIPVPMAIAYNLEPQTPLEQQFLPIFNGTLAGVLRWDPANGTDPSIPVPIEWSQVGTFTCCRLPLLAKSFNQFQAIAIQGCCWSRRTRRSTLLCAARTIAVECGSACCPRMRC